MERVLIVGDVHGCANELDRLLEQTSPERVVLLGDLFTRGPDPRGVWSLIRSWKADAVLGNHDEVVLKRWKKGKRLPKKAFKWLKKRPLTVEGEGWIAVHAGLHPHGHARTERHHALHMRRWPLERKDMPFWWDLYTGKKLVIHGHAASQGLLDRRPYTLGLDTGCVRGGELTGYLLDEDRLVSVKARRSYA